MIRFSANLGFLWSDRPLADAIRAAKAAGFDAVECHWPYDAPAADIAQALRETGLEMLGLNTRRGDVGAGENGLSALPGRADEARAAIDEALSYAAAIGCGAVHVMAGVAQAGAEADAVFLENLAYGAERAAATGATLLIEPLNTRDAPGYHLTSIEHGLEILERLNAPNVKLMFDCYHAQIMGGDLIRRLEAAHPRLGHVQIAGAPARDEPDSGEIAYPAVLAALAGLGWDRPIGAEYKPRAGRVEDGLGWLAPLRAAA